jgi:hypothetical protein
MSVVTPAATSAWERARQVIVDPALAYVEKNFTAKFFNWQQVGEPGDEKIGITHQLNGLEAQTRAGFTIISDRPQMQAADLYMPWTGKEYIYTIEDARKIMKAGANPAVPLARELGIGVDKVLWKGADAKANTTGTAKAQGITVHGITDPGTSTGTYARPLVLDGSTTAGKWDAAGAALKDINKVKSMLVKSGFSGPYGLFYPIGAAEAFNYPIVTAAATFGNMSVLEYASKVFDVVAPIPKDLSGNCIASGGAETEADFQMWGVALGSMSALYTQDFTIESLDWDKRTETGIIRGGARVLPSFEILNIGGSLFKGVVEIDAIDLHT